MEYKPQKPAYEVATAVREPEPVQEAHHGVGRQAQQETEPESLESRTTRPGEMPFDWWENGDHGQGD